MARNPKEMVRQVAAARELDSIEVTKNVKNVLQWLIFIGRR